MFYLLFLTCKKLVIRNKKVATLGETKAEKLKEE